MRARRTQGKGRRRRDSTRASAAAPRLPINYAGHPVDRTRARPQVEADRPSVNQKKKYILDHIAKTREQIDVLIQAQQVAPLLDRVPAEARSVLERSADLQRQFADGTATTAYVMAVDIRRSTELMLQSREPRLFVSFLNQVCRKLVNIVFAHRGVFEKFTGDGVLAFFPEVFTGKDAGLQAVTAAEACHCAWTEEYLAHRKCFQTVLLDVGLGIGIDYGTIHIARFGDGVAIIGSPVVYACRMANAEAGMTVSNQVAYESLIADHSAHCSFKETVVDVKHEGRVLGYRVHLNSTPLPRSEPGWSRFETHATE